MSLKPGTVLSHYRLQERIGAGGMGEVYAATDERLQRQVAIKILPDDLTRDQEKRARFQHEARLAAAFNHPNIATVHDVGEEDGVSFMVMERVQGSTLRALIHQGPLPLAQVVDLARGIAAGLSRAHREGVVHRDLKPDNVMLSEDGQPKILDFGLGKLLQDLHLPDEFTSQAQTAVVVHPDAMTREGSPYATRDGQILGTLAYMSPEQLQGRPVDVRSDIFSFGIMLYEMLTGERPFAGDSPLDTMTSILRDEAPTLDSKAHRDIPVALRRLVQVCLTKDPADRYASGETLLAALNATQPAQGTPSAGVAGWLRRPVALLAVAVVVAVAATAGWFVMEARRTARLHEELIPESQRLLDAGDRDGALRLLLQGQEMAPDDLRLQQLLGQAAMPLNVETQPSGAQVFMKGYTAVDRPWIPLGTTPLQGSHQALPARLRIEKEGYLPFEGGPFNKPDVTLRLLPVEEGVDGMVPVPGGTIAFARGAPVAVEPFWIDRYEVSNRQYREFTEAGGYRDPRYWREPMVKQGVEQPLEEALQQFVDTTGRPGPAGWELGSFPEGTGDHPVSGISWYEAAAFAAWSGTSLPTVYHWRQAAQQGIWGEILEVSNFSRQGAAPVGTYSGLGRFGTYDMAGNIAEWCFNAAGERRYVLGGSWADPGYRYRNIAAADPMERSPLHGFRRILTSGSLSAATTAPAEVPVQDFRQAEVVDDRTFETIRGLYAYDPSPLEARMEEVREQSDHWREEIISIEAAYAGERIPIHIFLPRNARPPFQAVVYHPGSNARDLRSSRTLPLLFVDFIPRTGRALVFPVYKGTFERQVELRGEKDARDLYLQINKDLRRTVDYLATREDLDISRLGYFGLSWGSTYGPLHTALEDRFKAAVLLVGGLFAYPPERPPEATPIHFAPRSTVPMMMINSRNDFLLPVETNVKPLLELLGADEADKRLVLIDGGHVPVSASVFIREALDWYDRYLGPVDTRP